MLVRNSSALRQEIWLNLRAEYCTTIAEHQLRILNEAPNICLNAFDKICIDNLGSHYTAFTNLTGMGSNHPIFPEVPSGFLSLTGDINSNEDLTFAHSGDLDIQMYQFVNDTLTVKLDTVGFIPAYELMYPIGPNSNALYGVHRPGLKIWLRVNVQPVDEDEYCDNERLFFGNILKELSKIKREYVHYIAIFEYFKKLFDELPSLNQMYKACPTILQYVNQDTKDNLFKTIKDKNEEKLDELKPPDEVALALARNKLRGKH